MNWLLYKKLYNIYYIQVNDNFMKSKLVYHQTRKRILVMHIIKGKQ